MNENVRAKKLLKKITNLYYFLLLVFVWSSKVNIKVCSADNYTICYSIDIGKKCPHEL